MEDKNCCVCNAPNKRVFRDKIDRCGNCYIIYLKSLLDNALNKKEYFNKLYKKYLTVAQEAELKIEECIKQIKYEDKALSDIVGLICDEKEKLKNENNENEK